MHSKSSYKLILRSRLAAAGLVRSPILFIREVLPVVSCRLLLSAAAALALAACSDQQDSTPLNPTDAPALASANATVGLNVLLKTKATPAMLTELGKYGSGIEQLPQINGSP
jgi:hypothetical protein